MGKQGSILAAILVLVLAAGIAIYKVPTQLGLDLRGGSQLTLQIQTTEQKTEITERDLQAVQSVVEGRVNGLGVSEAIVQSTGQNQLIVQLPGVSDPQQAERVLGGTAQLEFRQQKAGTEGQLQAIDSVVQDQEKALDTLVTAKADEATITKAREDLSKSRQSLSELFEKSQLTGDKLKDARSQPLGTASNGWEVALEFDEEGGDLFAQLTQELAGTGRSLGVFLDDKMLTSPTVDVQYAETGIQGGRAVISGNFNAESARDLEIQLRGGALPLPVQVVENRTVGATLGRDSIQRSLYAGIGGLALVLIFMAVYYRLPGILANIALVIYAILTWAAFNLLGVTMTLPGIAGFILSIGMAVDANVLIFERTREELRAGKTLYRSVEAGFFRAFSSILDSNVTTLIACAALFWFGAGLVKGFALTLAIGVVISMFTALTCTRNLLLYTIGFPQFRKPNYFCPGVSATPTQSSSTQAS
jgi:preprotein translocase subunit SecD